MNRADRQFQNYRMLERVHFNLRHKVAMIVLDLEGHGCHPLIDAGVYRSPAEQLKKFQEGNSKVRYSYHNVTGRSGTPESLAADITDAELRWNSPLSFWLRLASSAQAHQMTSGIYWGLNASRRSELRAIIARRTWNPGNVSIGWDPAHVQVTGISLFAAKRGKRP